MTKEQQRDLIVMMNEYFDVDISSPTRKRNVVDIRQVTMVVLRNMGYTTTNIGRMFGKDHATVLHAEKKVRDLMHVDPDMRRLYSLINEIVINYIQEKKIMTRKMILEDTERMRAVFCKLLAAYGEDVEWWLDMADISEDTYSLYGNIEMSDEELEEESV